MTHRLGLRTFPFTVHFSYFCGWLLLFQFHEKASSPRHHRLGFLTGWHHIRQGDLNGLRANILRGTREILHQKGRFTWTMGRAVSWRQSKEAECAFSSFTLRRITKNPRKHGTRTKDLRKCGWIDIQRMADD
ncbi:uncharacterized protein EI97DRAFT_129655 [Westerdykella ornata]|uniref:Uncharacterized protein n=1 Tax=Westerdykella ornata TaxID=318751 RepID=A0A6A6JD22_WESOR|nr:uncharacterized protein EI97DRAFT_129655 [Westerdykella ornata]KAF2274165.1 hypothetical protein EI97DRAFT_129655 [Westerdykella ornata]